MFATQGASKIEEEILFITEIPTTAERWGGGIDHKANASGSATGDEMKSDTQIFEEAAGA